MRRGLLSLAFVLAGCFAPARESAAPASTGAAARCQATATRDASGIVVAKGGIGLMEVRPASFPGEKLMVMVRRDGTIGDTLELRAVAEGADARGQVMWSTRATPRTNAWGPVVFEVNTKPIGNAGCWRITRNDGPQDDALFVDLG